MATGDVTLRLAGGRLQADRLEYSPANRVIWAKGAVHFNAVINTSKPACFATTFCRVKVKSKTSTASLIWLPAQRI